MIINIIQILTSLFLLYAFIVFIGCAWDKRENIYYLTGNVISALLSGCALFLIWR